MFLACLGLFSGHQLNKRNAKGFNSYTVNIIGLTNEFKIAVVRLVERATYAKLTELITEYDISVLATIEGK